jgi:hypothetical protein
MQTGAQRKKIAIAEEVVEGLGLLGRSGLREGSREEATNAQLLALAPVLL